jgi:chorismate-pyruvate lyase
MNRPTSHRPSDSEIPRLIDLESLLSLFSDSHELGSFASVQPDQLPEDYRRLLAHNDHMTTAIESFHGCPVDVQVLIAKRNGMVYVREILLRRTSDQAIVQYGIVRLQLSALERRTQDAILSEKIPLGRVLIEHNVLRQVELVELWQIEMGSKLAGFFGKAVGELTYGRTAMIHFGSQPALELLEIVTA